MKKLIICSLLFGNSLFATANPTVPQNYSSGAVLNHWMYEQQFRRNSPWALGNSNLGEQPAATEIYIEEGVLPNTSSREDVLLCPFNCSGYIVPPED